MSGGPASPLPAPPAVLDARLVPSALAVWLASYLAVRGTAAAVAWAAGGLAAGGLALLALLTLGALGAPGGGTAGRRVRWWSGDRIWSGRRKHRSGWCRRTARVVGFAACCAAAALLAGAMRLAARDASPVRELASRSVTAEVWLTVADDPRRPAARGAGGAPPGVIVPARLDRVRVGSAGWRLADRVLVLAPAEVWADLLPSQRVRATVGIRPPRGGDLTVAVLTTRVPPAEVAAPSWPHRAAGRLRSGLRDAVHGLPPGAAGLVPALVVGDESAMDPVVVANFRATGLSHLTAVSGMNVTLIVGAVLLALRAVSAGPRTSAVVAGVALVGFVVLARPSPSVLRAAVMGGIALLALALGRPRAVLPALAASVLGLLLWRPELARSAGFALSVLATAGLVVLAPGWAAALRRRRVPAGLAEAVAVPAAAFVVTAPVLAGLGGAVSLVTVPANLLAGPAVAPCTVLGLLAAVLSPVSEPAARVAAWLAGVPARWIVAVADRGAAAPQAVLPWPAGAGGVLLLVGVLAGLFAGARVPVARRSLLAAGLGALLVVIALPVARVGAGWPPPGWLVVACDVAQGDAVVVRLAGDSAVMVDTGPDPVAVDGCLRRLGVRRIPLLVLTHLHADHVGGLRGALHGRGVGAIQVGPSHEPAWAWRLVAEDAAAHRVPVVPAAVGEVRIVDGVRVEVLAPRGAFHGTRSDPNNSSIVLRVETRGRVLLLTGDVEVEAQRALLRDRPGSLAADVLKVPHHGSVYSDRDFLAAVGARLGIVSVGAGNDYGHPSPLLLAELARLGVRTLRTDLNGDVAVCDQAGQLVAYPRSRSPPDP
ncbi:MAG: ComEC/Rec2 family competence protein [Actinobacteria bacterium]|nr:ComEC/Rec2 family competence protein [Actinomycetota bacterium]